MAVVVVMNAVLGHLYVESVRKELLDMLKRQTWIGYKGDKQMERKWISVNKKLPVSGQVVNLAIRATNGNSEDGSYHIGCGHRIIEFPNYWACHYGSISVKHEYPLPMPRVTYWMPIPKPPEI